MPNWNGSKTEVAVVACHSPLFTNNCTYHYHFHLRIVIRIGPIPFRRSHESRCIFAPFDCSRTKGICLTSFAFINCFLCWYNYQHKKQFKMFSIMFIVFKLFVQDTFRSFYKRWDVVCIFVHFGNRRLALSFFVVS